jgi:hypothetical protein
MSVCRVGKVANASELPTLRIINDHTLQNLSQIVEYQDTNIGKKDLNNFFWEIMHI